MTDSFETPTVVDPDIRYYETFKATGNGKGYYVECDSMTLDGKTTYYAIIMPQSEYDELLRRANETGKAHHDSIQLMPWEYRQPFRPFEVLPWEVFIEQPGVVVDQPTRQAALKASLQRISSPKVNP